MVDAPSGCGLAAGVCTSGVVTKGAALAAVSFCFCAAAFFQLSRFSFASSLFLKPLLRFNLQARLFSPLLFLGLESRCFGQSCFFGTLRVFFRFPLGYRLALELSPHFLLARQLLLREQILLLFFS